MAKRQQRDIAGQPPRPRQLRQGGHGNIRARGMADHQHLIPLTACHLRDAVGEGVDAGLQSGRIGAAILGGEGVIMHQVIGEDPAIQLAPLPQPQHKYRQRHQQPRPPCRHQRHQPARQPSGKPRHQGLRQQHCDGIQRRQHRPAPQPHQPPQRARPDIGPGRARQLTVGCGNRLAHGTGDDVGPDQHLEFSLRLLSTRFGHRAPTKAGAVTSRAGFQRIAGNQRLFGALTLVKLAVTARRNRVVAGDIQHPAAHQIFPMLGRSRSMIARECDANSRRHVSASTTVVVRNSIHGPASQPRAASPK